MCSCHSCVFNSQKPPNLVKTKNPKNPVKSGKKNDARILTTRTKDTLMLIFSLKMK